MFKFLHNLYYKFVVLLCYYAGDLFSRLDSEFFAELYQKCMHLSFEYDEKINFWFWKYPSK